MCKSFKEKRIRVRKRDGDNCWLCNKIVIEGLQDGHPEMATLDHVVEVFRGGGNNLDNLRLAHAKCNNDRSNRKGLIRDWNQYLGATLHLKELIQSVINSIYFNTFNE